MTGKDIVLFILKYDLLNTKIDGLGGKELFLTIDEAAVKMGVSTTSLQDMIKLGLIDYIEFNDDIYLYKDVALTSIKKRR